MRPSHDENKILASGRMTVRRSGRRLQGHEQVERLVFERNGS